MNWAKILFWRKEPEEPKDVYEKAFITLTKNAMLKGLNDDNNKVINHYKGNDLFKTYPYSKDLVESLELVQGVPVKDLTEKEIKFPESGEIDPNNLEWIE